MVVLGIAVTAGFLLAMAAVIVGAVLLAVHGTYWTLVFIPLAGYIGWFLAGLLRIIGPTLWEGID